MDNIDGGGSMQRQFARKIIQTPANEIRKSATAAVKAAEEVVALYNHKYSNVASFSFIFYFMRACVINLLSD